MEIKKKMWRRRKQKCGRWQKKKREELIVEDMENRMRK